MEGATLGYPRRSKKNITYHGRTERPVIHADEVGHLYIMVRKRGGGTKRLYHGARYRENGQSRVLNLKGA